MDNRVCESLWTTEFVDKAGAEVSKTMDDVEIIDSDATNYDAVAAYYADQRCSVLSCVAA